MTHNELTYLGFQYEISHYEMNIAVPMLSGHGVSLQYFEANQYTEAHLVCHLPFVAGDEGKLHFCEMFKLHKPGMFQVLNLIRWLKVERPDLQIKTEKL